MGYLKVILLSIEVISVNDVYVVFSLVGKGIINYLDEWVYNCI